jgi:hypothetical protein
MSKRSSLSVLAVLAASGALITGCSSSSSVSTPTTAASATVTLSAPASSTASSTAISAADCTIISKVGSGAITTLMPLQSESTSQATASMKTYLTTLSADEAKLDTAQGKAALGAFITAMGKTLTEPAAQSESSVATAITNLTAACP